MPFLRGLCFGLEFNFLLALGVILNKLRDGVSETVSIDIQENSPAEDWMRRIPLFEILCTLLVLALSSAIYVGYKRTAGADLRMGMTESMPHQHDNNAAQVVRVAPSATITIRREITPSERNIADVDPPTALTPAAEPVNQPRMLLCEEISDRPFDSVMKVVDGKTTEYKLRGEFCDKQKAAFPIFRLTCPLSNKMAVVTVDWNSTGAVLGVAFDGTDVCKSLLCTYDFQDKSCNKSISQPSILRAIHFNPAVPNLIAGGRHNGDVVIWDLGKGDAVTSYKVKGTPHRNPVLSIHWLTSINTVFRRSPQVVAIHTDGVVMIWSCDEKLKSMNVESRLRVSERLTIQSSVTNLSCCSMGEDRKLVIGTLDGRLIVTGPVSSSQSGASLLQCRNILNQAQVSMSFVESAPLNRKIFMAASTDEKVQLFSTNMNHPFLTLRPGAGSVKSAAWSPTRAPVLAVGGTLGNIIFFDLLQFTAKPVFELRLDVPATPAPISCMKFNPRKSLLATGFSDGTVRIIQLSESLTEAKEGDDERLEDLRVPFRQRQPSLALP